jgi:hypothetical protein
MQLIADFMLIAGAVGAALYCMVLSQRLRRLTDLDGGLGVAIAVLSAQVTDMTSKIDEAKTAAQNSTQTIDKAVAQAEAAARRLELLLASLHDLPSARSDSQHATKGSAASEIGTAARMHGTRRASGFGSARDPRRERIE